MDASARLDNAVLLAPPVISPGDAAVHPAVRAAAVLADLEAWNVARGDRAAALRALRSAVGTLKPVAFHTERMALLDAYAAKLEGFHDLPGYPSALADLALAVWNEGYSRPEGRARSRELATKGRDTHPDTPGGRACESFLALLGPPVLELTAMRSDGPGRRSLRVRSRGVPEAFLRAYRVDAASALGLIAGDSSRQHETLDRVVREGQPVATWSVRPDIPEDGEVHTTWVTPPLAANGAYVITAATGPELAPDTMARVLLLLTSLVAVTLCRRGARHRGDRGLGGDTGSRSAA